MSKKVKKVFKKEIVSIRKFINEYLQAPPYKGERKLTHYVLEEHLLYHQCKLPRKITFNQVKKEDIIRNTVVYVRDEKGKKVVYVNPLYRSIERISRELENLSKEDLLKIRKKMIKLEKQKKIETVMKLYEEGFIKDNMGNLVSIDDIYYERLEENYVQEERKRRVICKREIYRKGEMKDDQYKRK